MSEFLAEASVLIRPDTTKFRALLEAELAAATKIPLAVPVTPVVSATGKGAAGGGIAAQTALLEENTAALATNAGEQRLAGAAAEKNAAAERLVADAAAQNAAIQEQLAAVTQAGILTTTNLARAKAELAAASKLVVPAEESLNAALATQDELLIANAAETQRLVVAQVAEAQAAAEAAAAQARHGAAVAGNVRREEQLARGAGATALSQLGLRGATLAASGAFLGGAAAITILAKSVGEASREQEALARVERVLGGTVSKQLEESSRGLATSFGLSATEALRAEGAFAELFHNVGISNEQAGQFSEQMVKLAADVAAFNNVPIDQTLKAIQLGLAGNTRGLKQYGIVLSQSQVTQEGLLETGKKYTTNLTQQELVLARLRLIQRDSANQLGAAAARSQSLAGQSRILAANIANLSAQIGQKLSPALTRAIADVNLLLLGLQKLSVLKPIIIPVKVVADFAGGSGGGGLEGFVRGALKTELIQAIPVFGPQIVAFRTLDGLVRTLFGDLNKAAVSARGTAGGFGEMAADARVAAGSVGTLDAAIRGLNQSQIAGQLQQQKTAVSRAQAFGGSGIPELEKELARIDRIIASRRGKATRGQNLQSLFDERKAVVDQIASIEAGFAADAKTAADKVKAAADKQDQALLALFGTQQTRITDRLISAGPKQAIALTIRLRNLFRRQREEARKQIKDLQLRAQTLLADTTEIKTLNKQIADLQKAQADALAAQIQQQRQDRLTHLEALLSIAETTPGTKDDVRRLKAIEAFDRARIAELKKKRRLTREEKQELDALRVDLAQREEALRGLTAQQKKNTQAQAEFTFLQTQTGFVQNLLGNLIPGTATGLVGGQSRSPGIQNVRPSINAANTASQLALGKPASAGQANVQIDVLRKILATLQELKKGSDHPEAKKQRHTGSAAMDYHIQGTYGM